jgi:hypothetical protein
MADGAIFYHRVNIVFYEADRVAVYFVLLDILQSIGNDRQRVLVEYIIQHCFRQRWLIV